MVKVGSLGKTKVTKSYSLAYVQQKTIMLKIFFLHQCPSHVNETFRPLVDPDEEQSEVFSSNS